MPSETLRYDVISTADTRGLKDTARDAGLASAAAKELSERLGTQSKTAQVAAGAAISLAKSDKLLADAEEVLSGRAEEAALALRQQARQAEESAAKTKLAAEAAKGGASSFGAMASPLGAAVVAGAALAPIAVTLAAGLGGLGLAALATTKHTSEMNAILGPLKAEVRDFQNSLQPQVLAIFGDGAGIAADALKQLQPVAAATGNALHAVLGDVGTELRSGQWQQFFAFMAQQAGPDLQLVGKLFVDLLHDIPPLLEQLQPAARLLLFLADGALKAVGGLERLHLVLPIVGAAAGLLLGGGPIGALIGAFSGLAIQEFAAARATKEVAAQFQAVAQVKFPSSAAVSVDWAAVAGSLGTVAVSAADVKNAMIDLHPKIGTIRGDMDLLNIAITSGNVALAAYSDLWNKFVGNAVSDQQAVLNVTQAFESFDKTVQQSGRTSTAARQAFLGIFTAVGSGLDTLRKNGASVQELNSFYQTSISRLNALHGLTPTQRADIQGVTKDYIAWASSVQGLSGKVVTAAGDIRNNMLVQLGLFHRLAPATKADTDAFANAILKTGSDSRATAADRQRLINDLIHSGLSATDAKAQVIKFQAQINALKGKTVNVAVTASGSGGLKITGPGASGKVWDLTHNAAGGMITGGVPGKDSVLGLLMPGEVVVPTAMVKAGAVDHLRGRLPGFDAGGLVQAAPWAANNLAGLAGPELGGEVAAVLRALVKAAQASSSGFIPGAPATGSAAAAQAFALSILPAGWSWPALVALWNQESGWNPWAVNPSSGAYGIPQALPAVWGHPYALGDYANQVRWGIAYISQRYGSSQAAEAHELAAHWYDQGGWLKPGLTLAMNGTGRPEQVIPAGRSGEAGAATIVIENHGVIGSQAETDRWLENGVNRLAKQGKLTYALRRSPSAA